MAHPHDSDPFEQLPQSDDSRRLERESLKQLNMLFPSDRFVLRPDLPEDFGVDVTIEVLAGGSATNARAFTQIKGRTGLKENANGSVSLSLEVKNINYLLRGSSPMCFLYTPESKAIRYVWIRDEVKRIEATTPTWREQQTVSLHFTRRLESSAFADIADRILSESQLMRSVQTTLVRLSERESVQLRVQPGDLTVSAPDENARLLETSGFVIVSSGFPSKAEELYGTLGPDDRTAKVRLVHAYALFSMGRYIQADAALSEIVLAPDNLDSDDAQFCSYLQASADYAAGRLDRTLFDGAQDSLEQKATGLTALQYRLNRAHQNALFMTSYSDEAIAELAKVTELIEDEPESAWPVKLRARAMLLRARGQACVGEFAEIAIMSNTDLDVQRSYFGRETVSDAFRRISQRWEEIEDDLGTLVDEAKQRVHPPLLCEILLARAQVRIGFLGQVHLLTRIHGKSPIKLASSPERVREDLDAAIAIGERCQLIEDVLRSKLLLAGLLELLNRANEAKAIGESVLRVVRALRLSHLTAWAEGHATGQTVLKIGEAAIDDGTCQRV